MALSTTTNPSSSQTNTQNPQTEPSSNFGASQSSGGVQPGTNQAILNSSNGIRLTNPALPSVNLNSVTAGQAADAKPLISSSHHLNGALLGLAIILIVSAAAMFWAANHSVKNTT